MLRDTEPREALEEAIAALPPSLRAAFLLRDVEGLSTAEAAEALSLTETNLKVRLHRARLLLRERLSAFVAARGGRGSSRVTCQELVAAPVGLHRRRRSRRRLRAAVEAHLASCDKCHVVLDTTQCTILLSRAAQSPTLDAPRREALLRRLEKACRGGDSR